MSKAKYEIIIGHLKGLKLDDERHAFLLGVIIGEAEL